MLQPWMQRTVQNNQELPESESFAEYLKKNQARDNWIKCREAAQIRAGGRLLLRLSNAQWAS